MFNKLDVLVLNRIFAACSKGYVPQSITNIIGEQCPKMPENEAIKLADYIDHVLRDIENYFYERYNFKDTIANQKMQTEGYKWVHEKYPWMDEENVLHTVSRAMYYAWHG